jgi:hypothetical protein
VRGSDFRPSPHNGQVGSCIISFEACSAFTHGGRRVNVVPPPNFMAIVVGRRKTRKPVRDPWPLLGAAALILIGSGTALRTLIVHELWTRLLLTLIAVGCIAMVVFLYF